jgi:UDP-glucose 4-epimerase
VGRRKNKIFIVNYKNCLILGGGGFIGSHLCDELIENGYNVTIFDKLNFSHKNIEHNLEKIKIIEGDFNNEVEFKNILKDIDVVYHLVSSTLPAMSNDNPVYDVETNLISTLKFINEAIAQKTKKIIFISSGGTVYGIPNQEFIKENHPLNPICSYGIIKKTIEDYLYMFYKLYNLDYYVFRLSNPYGERQNPLVAQGVVPVFLKKVLNKEKIEIWGDGTVTRDYIYIKDAVKVMVESLKYDTKDKIFNLSSGKGIDLNDLIKLIEKVAGAKANVVYKEKRQIDVPRNVLDNTLLKKVFNWKQEILLEDGIKKTYEYIKKEYTD